MSLRSVAVLRTVFFELHCLLMHSIMSGCNTSMPFTCKIGKLHVNMDTVFVSLFHCACLSFWAFVFCALSLGAALSISHLVVAKVTAVQCSCVLTQGSGASFAVCTHAQPVPEASLLLHVVDANASSISRQSRFTTTEVPMTVVGLEFCLLLLCQLPTISGALVLWAAGSGARQAQV